MDNNRQYSRQSDIAIHAISENVTQLKSDFHDMRTDLKDVMKEFSESVAKLVVLEEKSIHTNINMERILKIAERAHERVDKLQDKLDVDIKELEKRVDVLEKDSPLQKQTSNWILSAVWAAAGLAVMFVAKAVGIL
jgi:predicted nuclease with TOPRIM domain